MSWITVSSRPEATRCARLLRSLRSQPRSSRVVAQMKLETTSASVGINRRRNRQESRMSSIHPFHPSSKKPPDDEPAFQPLPLTLGSSESMQQKQFRYYDLIMAAFVTVLLCSNLIGASKVCVASGRLFGFSFHFNFGAGVLFFPISYIFGDVLTE